MTGFTHPELGGRVLPFPAHSMENLRLPPASADKAAVHMQRLVASAGVQNDSKAWREFSPSLKRYDYIGFMTDASAEAYCRQSCCLFTRDQIDKIWCALCSVEPPLRGPYANGILQHYEHPEYGIRADISHALQSREFRVLYDSADHFHWYVADVIRAVRIALPAYAIVRNFAGVRQTIVLLDGVVRAIEAAENIRDQEHKHVLDHLGVIINEEIGQGYFSKSGHYLHSIISGIW